MPQSPRNDFEALQVADPQAAAELKESVDKRVFRPHDGGQKDVLRSTARFRVVRAGRRWGKTKVAARIEIRKALDKPGSMNWWIANSYRNVRRGYKEVVRQIPPELLAKPAPASTAQDLALDFVNGSRIEFYSAGNPDALAGEGVDFVVADEAALWPKGEEVWYQLVRPTLADHYGNGLLISTPRGRNWFYDLDMKGRMASEPEFESWHFRQTDNPYIPQSETDALRDEMPDVLFRQEIMGEYVANAASIFDLSTPNSVIGFEEEPEGHIYIGIDLARKNDFSVITAVRESDRLPVYHTKFKDIKWPIQRERIIDVIAEIEGYPAVTGTTVMLDQTAVGDVVVEELQDEGHDVLGLVFTNQWKRKAVVRLSKDLELGNAHILEVQREEFESYEYEITEAGNYKFEAATGHDDEVSAKLLEHWALTEEGSPDFKTDTEVPELDGEVTEVTLVADTPGEIASHEGAWND